MKKFKIIDAENGDMIIEFADEMLKELGWKEGDSIIIDKEDDKLILKKVNYDDNEKG